MEFVSRKIEEYSEAHSTPESELLKRISRETHESLMLPGMLAGHLQGRFLSLLSHLVKPKTILEIGTYTGYSALCLAEGMPEDGVLHTIDINQKLEGRVREYFAASGFGSRIVYHIGNALQIVSSLPGPFDLVFLDADKEHYGDYYDLLAGKIRPGGLLIADNVLWKGRVADETAVVEDKRTRLLDAFNKKVLADASMDVVMLPVRDGLLLARKK